MRSAGLLIYDVFADGIKILLVHPGGPHWAHRQGYGWGIPKGKVEEGETLIEAALREAKEELGQEPFGQFTGDLGSVKQNSKKTVYCFAWLGSVDLPVKSLMIEMEYPKNSGDIIEVPEIGEGRWFTPEEAEPVIIRKQYVFIERLLERLQAP